VDSTDGPAETADDTKSVPVLLLKGERFSKESFAFFVFISPQIDFSIDICICLQYTWFEMSETVDKVLAFQWDEGNAEKIWIKHGLTQAECEQVFFNLPFLVFDDQRHSLDEERFYALGRTDAGKGLFVVFTYRDQTLIRIISARKMTVAERNYYNFGEKRGMLYDE